MLCVEYLDSRTERVERTLTLPVARIPPFRKSDPIELRRLPTIPIRTAMIDWVRSSLVLALFAFGVALYGQTTIVEGVGVRGEAWVGMTRREVKAMLGKCYDNRVESTKTSCIDCPYPKSRTRYVRTRQQWTYGQRGITLMFSKNRVSSIYYTSADYRTSKGISPGDSAVAIPQAYGPKYSESLIIYTDLGVSFFITEGRVMEIRVFTAPLTRASPR